MTGEWQVNGRSRITYFDKVVDLDLQYQQKWHPLYGLLLIIRTIHVVLKRKDAY
ncbi:MAG: sugar transferase [Richelia sp.]|nr:sugar transferase [Richelia sp.]